MSAPDTAQEVANLRLPVPFFDLLMVLLVTCLVFVAPMPQDAGSVSSMEMPIAQGKSGGAPANLLAVVPRQAGQVWVYQVSGEKGFITPQALAERAMAESRKIVLVVPPATALQDFVNMQTALTAMNVPFALAIKNKETAP